jgi:hypothetical protein
MHPRLAELLRYMDDQAAVLRAAYDAVPPERRTVRPSPDRWSPAEVVHHVAITERRLAQRMAALIEQARALPPERDASPILPTLGTGRVLDRTKRFVTSEAGQPRDTDAARVWEEFDAARRALKDVIVTGDGLALGEVSAPHPALGSFDGYQWIAFAGAHAGRHADQIREMSHDAGQLGF